MAWFVRLFGFSEEPFGRYAKDYSRASAWGVKAEGAWCETENAALFELEKTGEGG